MQQRLPSVTWPPPHPATDTTFINAHQPQLQLSNSSNVHLSSSTTRELMLAAGDDEKPSLAELVSENAMIVFASRGCCMFHALRCLLLRVGVNPNVYHFDKEDEAAISEQLSGIVGAADDKNDKVVDGGGFLKFPVVFVGGKLFGGFDKIMIAHIAGELVPILREARVLWL